MKAIRSTCPYCGVGCGVIVDSQGGEITGVRGDPDHPANQGRLCSKGQTLHLSASLGVQRQVRLATPMGRRARDAGFEPLAWGEALDRAADGIAGIVANHGPEAVGLYLSGQLLTEDYYVFNKLGKALIGTPHVDTNSRLCMSSAVAGYKASLGADAVPACYEDLDHAACVFIAGSNLAWAHPVLMRRLEAARAALPQQRWVVVDPRRTETAAAADLHLQLLPGTDVVLFHAMLHVMVWEGLLDDRFVAEHTEGFAALRARVAEFTPAAAARSCGLKEDDIVQAARWFAGLDAEGSGTRRPTLSMYCQGLNQSAAGTDKNRALLNLHLATGQIGQAGAGPLSLTGQPNAMGGREVGALANLLPGHRDMSDAGDRAAVESFWGLKSLPAGTGKAAVEMFEAAADGQIKALWVACTNPLASMPDSRLVRRALERVELLIVQDAVARNATADLAHLLLPAASWGEREGTVTNSERRISRVRASLPPFGQARPDWQIVCDIARRLEARLPDRRDAAHAGQSMFAFDGPEAIWNEHRDSTRGRDLDITGLSWPMLDQAPRQWPWPAGDHESPPRLFGDGRFFTPGGRARFADPAWRGPAETRDARHPFALNTGRLRDQWHTMARTGTLGRLHAHGGGPALQLHPQDLLRLGLKEGGLARVSSRRGSLVLPAAGSDAVAPAQAFIAMHWGPEWLAGGGVNTLMPTARCPQSRQPELKHAAVKIERADLPWRLSAVAWLPAHEALEVRAALSRLFAMPGEMSYASATIFGREPGGEIGVEFQAAAGGPVEPELLARIATLLGLDAAEVLRYEDGRAGQRRLVRIGNGGAVQAYLLAGDTAAQSWLKALLQSREAATVIGHALLSGRATAPAASAMQRSPQVCTCFDVAEGPIRQAAAAASGDAAARLAAVQRSLRCGTECGSCLPALRTLVAAAAAAEKVAA
jgi:assimilatory nitrate reductase catalytic subunit